MSVFDILVKYREGFLSGLGVTLQLCLIIWTLGILLGATLGALCNRWKISVGIPARIVSFTLGGIPVLVLLFWLHYPVQSIFNVVIDPFYTAAATLSLINIFSVSDLVRQVLNDFPNQYVVAANVCGLTPRQTTLNIKLPIVLRQVLPGLLILQVSMLQATLFASLISVDEVFRIAQRINSQVYRPVEIYSALAFFFLAICLPLNGLALWLRTKFTRDLSEQ